MRILHVTASIDPQMGGVSQAIKSIIRGLNLVGGHQNEVVSLDPSDADYLQVESFPVHALGPGQTSWAYSPQLLRWLLQNISRFDVVIIHGLWLYPGYALEKALTSLRVTSQRDPSRFPLYYVMPHGMLDPYFQRDPSRKVKALRNWIYWKMIENKVVGNADGLLFTCEEEMLLARESFLPYLPLAETVVGLGVEDPPAYNLEMRNAFTRSCPELEGRTYFLFLSRIHPKKGVNLLIEAYAELLKTLKGDCNITVPALVIAGPVDSAYASEMQRFANELIPSRDDRKGPEIFFPGMLQGNTKWGAFYGCDAFILPSHQENFGIAIVEALACAKAVLISNKVNIWREIGESKAGVVAADDEIGTKQLLQTWLILSDSEQKAMSSNARRAYENYFSVKPAAAKMERALQNQR